MDYLFSKIVLLCLGATALLSTFSSENIQTAMLPPVVVDCGENFFDPGGPNGSYVDGPAVTTTICPDMPGEFVEVTFTSFDTELNQDFLTVYDGDNVGNVAMFALHGQDLPPVMSATNPTGCLTFYFATGGTSTGTGWEALVDCVPCPRVNSLQLSNVGRNSVIFNFYVNSWPPANPFHCEIGLPGFVPGTGTAVATENTNQTSVQVGNLAEDTEYEVYVRQDCTSGVNSAFAGPLKFKTAPSCGDNFYDSGGQDAGYSNFEGYSVSICPDAPGQYVEVDFSAFNFGNNYFAVLNGDWGNGNFIGNYSDAFPPTTVGSTDPTGCLTFQFSTLPTNPIGDGWEANVSCVTCPKVQALYHSFVSINSVNFIWSPFQSAQLYIWEIGPSGFTPGTGTATTSGATTTNSALAIGLESGTDYEVCLQAVCSTGNATWSKHSFRTNPSCGDQFYDTGGPNGNYISGSSTFTVICPDVPGEFVSLEFQSFEMAPGDYLGIYNSEFAGGPYFGSFYGTQIPSTITATSPSGCLTLFEYVQNSTTGPGWAASVNCVTCPAPSGLYVFDAAQNSVSANWEAFSNAQNYYYEVVPYGAQPGSGSAVASGNVSANSIFISGLESGTPYQFYLKTVCGANDESAFTAPVYFATLPTCGDSFFDQGGPGGSYAQNSNYCTTICPDVPGTFVQVSFNEFEMNSCCDQLSIWDLQSQIGVFTGNALPPAITSSDATGCLTFCFSSNTQDPLAGWDANIDCVTCPNPRNLRTDATTTNTAIFEWDDYLPGTIYQWELGLPGFQPGTGAAISGGNTVQSNSFATNLESGTFYEVYVRSECSAGDFSVFTGPLRFYTNPTCGDTFTDPGGASGDFTPGTSQVVVICPDVAGTFVEVDFTEFDLGDCCSNMSVWDANSQNGGTSIGYFTQGTFPTGPLNATNSTGCLTFYTYFYGDAAPGWVGEVNCVNCPKPNSANATEVFGGHATLLWNGVFNGDFSWEIGVAGFVPGNGEAVQSGDVTGTTVTISGLQGATEYEFYVKTNCGSESSEFSGPGKFYMPPSCGDAFTDRGGANGNYGPWETFPAQLCPDQPGTFVQLAFSEFDILSCCASMVVQDGNGQYYGFSGSQLPRVVTSNNPNGCVYVEFYNNSDLTAAGWEGSVTCVDCPPPGTVFVQNSGAQFEWTNLSFAQNYDWEIVPTGVLPGTGQAAASGSTFLNYVTPTGLDGSTLYHFYVRTNCSNGSSSEYSGPHKFLSPPTCGDIFYDPAGPDSSYVSNGFTSYTTICPDLPGTVVEVTFLSLDIHPWEDNVYVFDGNNPSAPLISSFNGMAMPLPGPFTATNAQGCLTFQLNAYASGIWEGWEAAVACVTCPKVTGLTASALNEVTMSWNAHPSAVSFNWEVGLLGFVPGTGTALAAGNTTSTNAVATGLDSGTEYDFYVAAVCANGETSGFGAGGHFTTPPSCGDNFYDNGGLSGNYPPSQYYTTTICPQGQNQQVSINFTSFSTESCCDYLTFYDGPTSNAPNIMTQSGQPAVPFAVTSTHPSGCLTMIFYADGSVEGFGWTAEIECEGCALPLNFDAGNITSTGAMLSWEVVGPASFTYNYEVGASGFTPGIGTALEVGNTADNFVGISTLAAGANYDAYVRSICDGGSTVGDFAGPVSFSTSISCGSTLYDTGEENGDYGPNENYYTLICPEVPGSKASLDFIEFETQECCDFLEILNGNTETAPSLGVFSGNDLPGTLISSDASGCLMLHFTSDATVHRSGWKALVECVASPTNQVNLTNLGIEISPNPASQQLFVKLPTSDGGHVEIIDVAGRVAWRGEVQLGDKNLSIELHSFHPGVYLLRWQGRGARFVVER